MEPLGSLLQRVEDSVAEGKRTYNHDFTTCKSYQQVSVTPLDAFRASLERVTRKAKQDFIDCIYQSAQGNQIHGIVSLVPQTEACYAMLSGDNVSFDFHEKEFRTMFDPIWLEFLGWMKEQGLLLWMGSYRDKFGVRTFVMLQAFVRTEASLDAQRKKVGSRTPVISLFVE
jgi:hypothetical protein